MKYGQLNVFPRVLSKDCLFSTYAKSSQKLTYLLHDTHTKVCESGGNYFYYYLLTLYLKLEKIYITLQKNLRSNLYQLKIIIIIK